MKAWTVAEVVASQHPDVIAGDTVSGAFGVQDYALSDGRGVRSVDPRLAPGRRISVCSGSPA